MNKSNFSLNRDDEFPRLHRLRHGEDGLGVLPRDVGYNPNVWVILGVGRRAAQSRAFDLPALGLVLVLVPLAFPLTGLAKPPSCAKGRTRSKELMGPLSPQDGARATISYAS